MSTTFFTISWQNSVRYYRKIIGTSSKVRDPSSGYKQPSPSRYNSLKVPNIKCHKNSCSGNRVVSCWRTDRHNGESSRISYLPMYLKMCTGAEHTATHPYNFIAWYKDSLTFITAPHTHLYPFHPACQSDHFEPLLGEFCSNGRSNAAACSCYHSHSTCPALHLKTTQQ